MDEPPVSVVVPAYNAAATLARALDSIAAQTRPPAEVIVVDDASGDATAAIAEAHVLRPAIVRHAANRGGAAALQSGLEAARHDWVAFLDADDEWLPRKLELQAAALVVEPDASVVASGFVFVGRDGREAWEYGVAPFRHDGRDFWRNLLVDSSILQSSAMVPRRMVLATGGVAAAMRTGYDQQLFVRLAALGPVAYVHQRLVRYHDSPGSLTKLPRAGDILDVLAMHERHVAMFAERLSEAERREALRHRYAEAARGLVAARSWAPATRCMTEALKRGEPPGPMLWRLATNLPPLRQLKRLARGV
jgi:glycosyltransferase involved in cell wall biosynthesis